MRKLIMVFALTCSFSVFGQQYDVYVEYRFNSFDLNGSTGARTSLTNFRILFPDGKQMNFDRTFESSFIGPSTLISGVFSGRTGSTTLTYQNNLYINQYYAKETGNVNGIGYVFRSNFKTDINPQGWYMSGTVSIIEKIKIIPPNPKPICYKNQIMLEATLSHPIRYEWEYKGTHDPDFISFGESLSHQNVSLSDLYSDPQVLIKNIGKPIHFRIHNVENNYYSDIVNYTWLACSPNLLPDLTIVENVSCFGSNDGGVTLTFDKNIDKDNGYQMRYFVFDQNANLNFDPAKENPPQTVEQEVLDELTAINDGTGYYKGTLSTGLSKGNYKIVYQEFFDAGDGADAIVKSGGVTPPFEIKEPTQIVPSATITQAQCYENEATIIFSATGGNNLDASGTYKYLYQLNGDGNWMVPKENPERIPTTSFDQTVQIKAIYSIGNCESEAVALTEKINSTVLPLTFTNPASGTTASYSSMDGVIGINYDGGTPMYSFQLAKLNEISSAFEDVSNPNMINNLLSKKIEFRDLGIGIYRITIIDQNNCSLSTTSLGDLSVSSRPLPLLGLEKIGQISCPSAGDGAITVHVSGGVMDYNYQWTINNVASPYETIGFPTISMNNISEPGEYILKVASRGFTDFNDPSGYVTTTISLAAPEEVIIQNATVNNISCKGAQDGSITITPSGGSSYQYKLDFFDPWQDLIANTIPISASGFYDLYLRNENGCEATPIRDLSVDEPEEFLISEILSTNPSFTASDDGVIDITLEGGTLPYTYLWSGPNGLTFSREDINGLAPGSYRVTATDANGCTVTSPIIPIFDPSELLATLNQTVSLECFGDDFAELTANVTGGTNPYTYEWFQTENGNDIRLMEDSPILGNLSAGTYFLRVTDTNGVLVDTPPATISQPGLLSIVVDNLTNVTCNGLKTGAIDISVTGGTAPYNYLWSNGEISEDLANIPSGTYSLEVLDENGCRAEIEITIVSSVDTLKITNENIKGVSEYHGNDGSISFEPSGGVAPYSIIWTKGEGGQTVGNDKTISNLSPGIYEVFVTDSKGCSLNKVYIIEQPDIVQETIVPISCWGKNDGSISILVNQGNGIFDYIWNTGATTNIISDLSTGIYTVTIIGFEDTAITRTYVIDEPLPLVVDLGKDKTLCAGQILDLDATVEDPSATYSWTSDTGFISSDPIISVSTTGNYSIIVSNSSGCSASGSVFIDVAPDRINAEFAVSSQVFAGEALVAVDISYPLPEMVEWIVPKNASVKAKNGDELELSFNAPGEYKIGLITKRGFCEATQIKKVLVLEKDLSITGKNDGQLQKRVKDFIIYPNPADGKFTADISLDETGEINLKIFSFANNTMIDHKKEKGKKLYSIPFDLSGIPSGVYAVLLETPYGNALRKVVIK